ncbi:hypothetical protein M413DRAFT_448663 [Hebeloma cylindrosporum]|uniref:Uncharacterized protein n=1 Tax=Hebeloma cylindrosporum TaxID=76867 RepID=A0A0C2XH30_HEBCY|nr:hypothetical protein M413DRAFT_448663 [Hebeloma cylindrosporum h7]
MARIAAARSPFNLSAQHHTLLSTYGTYSVNNLTANHITVAAEIHPRRLENRRGQSGRHRPCISR